MTDWMSEARCADPSLGSDRARVRVFFPPARPGKYHTTPTAEYAMAKALCAQCPVVAECLTAALDRDEPDGVWGGKTPVERRRLTRFHRFPCARCGTRFHRTTRSNFYCSPACKEQAHRDQQAASAASKERPQYECEVCGLDFGEEGQRWRAHQRAGKCA